MDDIQDYLKEIRSLMSVSSHFVETKDYIKERCFGKWLQSLDNDTLSILVDINRKINSFSQNSQNTTDELLDYLDKSSEKQVLGKCANLTKGKLSHEELSEIMEMGKEEPIIDGIKLCDDPLLNSVSLLDILTLAMMGVNWEMGMEFNSIDEYHEKTKMISPETFGDTACHNYLNVMMNLAKYEYYKRTKDDSVFILRGRENTFTDGHYKASYSTFYNSICSFHNIQLLMVLDTLLLSISFKEDKEATLVTFRKYSRKRKSYIYVKADMLGDVNMDKLFEVSELDTQNNTNILISSNNCEDIIDYIYELFNLEYNDSPISRLLDVSQNIMFSSFYLF
jgi:hypothetical protein